MIDMPKVTQMLDNGWRIRLFKNDLGSYTAMASHHSIEFVDRVKVKLLQQYPEATRKVVSDDMAEWLPRTIETDDRTPELALTRLAYKVHGEVLSTGDQKGEDV